MSRRISFLMLAASAALIATQASADPECFRDSCQLPEVVEPPAAAVQTPNADEAAAPETSAVASEASLAAPELAPAKALPQMAADPVARPPVPPIQTLADEASVPPLAPRPVKALPPPMRVPVAVAPAPMPVLPAAAPAAIRETNTAPAGYVRSARISSPDPTYVVGYNAAPVGGIVVVVPGAVHGTGRYMFAPSAKIISIENGD
jgi:hypothetical protein